MIVSPLPTMSSYTPLSTSYPSKTILRYFSLISDAKSEAKTDDHFTAIILDNGVLQVKPQKQSFASVDAWLETLPGYPTNEDLRVEEPANATPDASWKVHNDVIDSWQPVFSWTTYLYKVIMKHNASLKNNAELRKAFNHLVDVMEQYKPTCYTRIPCYSLKHYHFVLMNTILDSQQSWDALPVRFYKTTSWYHQPIDSVQEREAFAPQIYAAYKPLYGLMAQHGIISRIRTHHEEQEKKAQEKREEWEKRRKEKILHRQKKRVEHKIVQLKRKVLSIQRKVNELEAQEEYLRDYICQKEKDLQEM